MKKLIFVVFALIFVSSVNAQILRNIARSAVNQAKNSAENRAEKEVDKKVDEEVNKSIDKMLESDSTKNKKSTQKVSENQDSVRASKFMNKLGISTAAVPHKEEYKFTGQIVTTMEVTDAKGEKSPASEFVTCFNEKSSDAMMKIKGDDNKSVTTTIVDVENKCMMLLTESDGSKSGFAMKFDPNSTQTSTAGQTSKGEEECTPAKTGNTKSISGYKCSEYRCETKDAITVAWVSKDFSAANNQLFGQSGSKNKLNTNGFDGMVMQYEFRSKNDKSSTTMTVKSIDTNKSSSFSTAGYQISNFSFNANKK